MRRSVTILDPGLGVRYVIPRSDAPVVERPFLWTCAEKSEIEALKTWFNSHRGRVVPFWAPTWRRDLLIAQDVPAANATFSIQPCGYTKYSYPSRARRHLVARLNTGLACREVTAATDNGTAEALTVSSAWGEILPVGTWLSFLTLCRLGSDELEIGWRSDGVAEAQLTFVEIPQEVP
jgi:hypothetical protein